MSEKCVWRIQGIIGKARFCSLAMSKQYPTLHRLVSNSCQTLKCLCFPAKIRLFFPARSQSWWVPNGSRLDVIGGVLYETDSEGGSGATGRVWPEIEKDDSLVGGVFQCSFLKSWNVGIRGRRLWELTCSAS